MSDSKLERVSHLRPGLYKVRRTTYKEPPCDGAFLCEFKIVDRRMTDDPCKIPANKGTPGDWWDKGERHRIENGQICRDMGWQREWVVEVADILEFVRKHGCCVVSIDADGFPCVEIYDGYRE